MTFSGNCDTVFGIRILIPRSACTVLVRVNRISLADLVSCEWKSEFVEKNILEVYMNFIINVSIIEAGLSCFKNV